jgi:hypothetical protein
MRPTAAGWAIRGSQHAAQERATGFGAGLTIVFAMTTTSKQTKHLKSNAHPREEDEEQDESGFDHEEEATSQDDDEDEDEDEQPAKPTQADVLLELAEDAECFHTPAGEPYASVPVADHTETWPLKSSQFRLWLLKRYYDRFRKPPRGQTLAEAIGVLSARAMFEGKEHRVDVRLAERRGVIFVDLGDAGWTTIVVSERGWARVVKSRMKFRRGPGSRALPMPEKHGSLEDLRRFVNVADEHEWRLLVAWMVMCFHGRGPYPALILQGEQGASKSTTARVMRDLIDPASPALRSSPRNEQDLMIAAATNRIVAFDNISGISAEMSDQLSRLATGGGIGTRQLYTNTEEILFEATRPILINGIDAMATRGDLADRSIVLSLPAIDAEKRKDEESFWKDFGAARPKLFGALLSVVGEVLRIVPSIQLASKPRMADFARWGVAVEEALEWPEGSFLRAYERSRRNASRTVADSDNVAVAIRKLVESQGAFKGSATHLLERLGTVAQVEAGDKYWPKTPNAFGVRLRRLRPALLALGVEVEVSRRGDERVIAISKVTPVVTAVTRHDGGDAPTKRKILKTASQKEKVRKKGRVVRGER